MKTYAVLENGKLYFYESRDEYMELGETLADPLDLRDFKVSLDRATINKHDSSSGHFSVSKLIRSVVNDTDEIRVRNRFDIDFDYMFAVNNFKFCLKPSSNRAKRRGVLWTRADGGEQEVLPALDCSAAVRHRVLGGTERAEHFGRCIKTPSKSS